MTMNTTMRQTTKSVHLARLAPYCADNVAVGSPCGHCVAAAMITEAETPQRLTVSLRTACETLVEWADSHPMYPTRNPPTLAVNMARAALVAGGGAP